MADNVGMMQRVLGKHVRVSFHTPIAPSTPPLFGGSLEADVFAVDVALKQVVLRRAIPHTVSKADYFVVACDVIESVALLRDADPSGAAPALGATAVARRLESARSREERRLEMQGVGVSEQEQKLFDELVKKCVTRFLRGPPGARKRASVPRSTPPFHAQRPSIPMSLTHPPPPPPPPPRSYPSAKWDGKNMLLNEALLLRPPYTQEQVEFGASVNDKGQSYLRDRLQYARQKAGYCGVLSK
jgi:hypothetical protein